MKMRTEKVKKLLRTEKTDALLVWNDEGSGQPATEWLSGFTPTPMSIGVSSRRERGFTGSSSILLISAKKRYLITDGRYTLQAKREAKYYSVLITTSRTPSSLLLPRLCKTNKLNSILFDGDQIPYSIYERLSGILPGVKLVSRNGVLQELREVKEKEEIKLLKQAAKIASNALEQLLREVSAGMTEREVSKRLEDLCTLGGAEGLAFPTGVASGRNGALPHAGATSKKIKNGELVTIDFGIRYLGYTSDMTRTIAVGKIPLQLKRMYEAVRGAQELGVLKARAGISGEKLDTLCRNYLERRGLGKYFTHGIGHGLGMEVHELPSTSRNSTIPFPVGSVITCEPGVYIPGVGGVRIEDTLVLTKHGNINITAGVTKKLIIL